MHVDGSLLRGLIAHAHLRNIFLKTVSTKVYFDYIHMYYQVSCIKISKVVIFTQNKS